MTVSMFPDFDERHPPPAPRKRREPAVGGPVRQTQAAVLRALQDRPQGDRELHEWLVSHMSDAKAGQTTMGSTRRAIDGLAKQGLIRDVGQRGAWTLKGREIVWHLVEQVQA